MSKVPDNARTDSPYYMEPLAPSAKARAALWGTSFRDARHGVLRGLLSDKTSMLVDAHEVCPMEDVEASKRPCRVAGQLGQGAAARSEANPAAAR